MVKKMIFLGFFFACGLHGMDEPPVDKGKDEASSPKKPASPERKSSADTDSGKRAETALTRRDSADDNAIASTSAAYSPNKKITPQPTPRFNLDLRSPNNIGMLKMSTGSQVSDRPQERIVRFEDLTEQVKRAQTVKSLKKKPDQFAASGIAPSRRRKFLDTGESAPSLPLLNTDDDDVVGEVRIPINDTKDQAPIQDHEKRMQQMEKMIALLQQQLSGKKINVADDKDEEISEDVLRRFTSKFGQGISDDVQHYSAEDMWKIIERFCPILFKIGKDRKMTLEDILNFDDMAAGAEIGSPVFLQIAHGFMGDDNSDATGSWLTQAWNYCTKKPDGVSLSQGYSLKRYEQMKATTPEQHKALMYEALKAAYEQTDGGVRRSPIFDTQMGMHTEQIADQEASKRNAYLGNAIQFLISIGLAAWSLYGQVNPGACPSNSTA